MRAFDLVRPLLFRIEAERAHALTIAGLARLPERAPADDAALATTVAGIRFPNPVGLAAGVDKNAEAATGFLTLGFGFVEVGTLTPLPQDGNPRPRLFRLPKDRAVINRMGFNNGGLDAGLARLSARRPKGIVGVNVGANKDAADRIADYAAGVARASTVADYVTVNISSPNTPGLRGLQSGSELTALLAAVQGARGAVPVFLKVAPDLDRAQIDGIARAAIDSGIDALIVSNTTIARPTLRSRHAGEAGGLSGAPLREPALQCLRDFRAATGGQLPLIGAGGIGSAEDAYARIRAGASLVQLYSALVYEGPGLARRMTRALPTLLKRDGFASVADAVGTG
ncbi:quinone-dependent dihydroorotate dehydrogenase [Sphingomonas prati]|uniref:Dihydroorotate dehydrogenase (quinone) n=1 Tax=Sphingomonas prati TaxID=1843237 RepID=A0A7W9F0Y2_9SPHN|nr:quinone-dependent dihydroorotate dehydrogenase [Sphingomonas prati]MBB5728882.1 dihydroorotate dehydrogenase [Sphingomonas prati]GGE86838.1 dihydroorotate dehydrogenase (quinone) [Sphingomonas prati]